MRIGDRRTTVADKSKKKTPEWIGSRDDAIFSGELFLPSFNVYVTRSDPTACAIGGGWGNYDIALKSGDAWSISYLEEKNEVVTADQEFRPLDPGYLRRILLQVLDREEYQEAVEYYQTQDRLQEVELEFSEGQPPTIRGRRRIRDADARAQVRISDLRLASALTYQNLRDFEDRLDQALSSLQLPITKDNVTRWKYKVLEGKSRREREFEERWKALRRKSRDVELSVEEEVKYDKEWRPIMKQEDAWITLVSFTAAALLLLHDLDMRNLKEAKHADLKESVATLIDIFKTLMGSVDRSVEDLSTLLVNRRPEDGSLPHPEIKPYTALVLYRMGHSLQSIARRIGINPREITSADEQKGSKNWRGMLFNSIQKGMEIERERFPRAADVFVRGRREERVLAEAVNNYYDYRKEVDRSVVRDYVEEFEEGDEMIGGPHSTTKDRKPLGLSSSLVAALSMKGTLSPPVVLPFLEKDLLVGGDGTIKHHTGEGGKV
jgi:hypothetical protein